MAKLNEQDFAENYGFALAFLRSDKELYGVFKQAVAATWSPEKFIAAVKNTKWYRTHGETYRQSLALEKSDPGTFQERVAGKFAEIADLSKSMGSTGSGKIVSQLARNAVLFGWNDSQLRDALAQYVKVVNGQGVGQAGDVAAALQQTAWRNGVKVSDSWLSTQARNIAAGESTLEAAQRQLREHYATSLAPAFEKQLKAGMDLYDIASPYIQSMASTLELNPADIDLFDPTIRSALNSKQPDGTNGTKTLYDFEQGLRNDKRWLKTKGAQDQTMAVAHQVLSDWGLAT